MTDRNVFYHLQSATMNPCSMVKEKYEEALGTWLCRGCLTPKENYGSIEAHIQEIAPLDPPMNFINGCGLGLVTKEFLGELGTDLVGRHLFVGRLFGPNGRLIDDWVTFRGKYTLIIKGSKNVSHRRCSECGRAVYFAMGKRYLYPMPPEDIDLFASDLFGFVLRKSMFCRLKRQQWPNVTVDVLEIPKEPHDSLGILS